MSQCRALPTQVVEESLLIFGWVANWRPIEIFLYEWWPVVRRRNCGEAYPPFKDGLPCYVKPRNAAVPKNLATEFAV